MLQTGTKGPVAESAPSRPHGGPLVPARNRAGTKGRSIENKKFLTITNKNSQDLIYEIQNNERERLDLHTLVDRTAETFI
jgi:hypothetical protein